MSKDQYLTKRVLLIQPNYSSLYENTKIKAGVIYTPSITLATIAAPLVEKGHEVKIIDLNNYKDSDTALKDILTSFSPQFVGITSTTVLFREASRLANLCKKMLDCTVIGGGPHASSFPESAIKEAGFDCIVVGEGDLVLPRIVEGQELSSISGLYFRNQGKIISTVRHEAIKNLDDLPYPAWHLYDISNYHTSELLTRKNPAGWIETSRGCPWNCVYCNKSVHGSKFRVKTPKRVVDEMEYMLKIGFKEIHIVDDCFTTNIKRAIAICDKILKRNLKFPWAAVNGIRADRVTIELFNKMKKAGCYRISIGIESGNQEILDKINKKLTLDQIRKAVSVAHKAGIEVLGFFMLALPGETEKTMEDTIQFAKELDLDLAKLAITMPLPGTPLFYELESKGLLLTKDWAKYNVYLPASEVYKHPILDWDIINKYYNRFYREFYWRPRYVWRRFWHGLRYGHLLSDIKNVIATKW